MLLAKSLGATPARSRADQLVSDNIAGTGDLISGRMAERGSLVKRSLGGLSWVFAKSSSRSYAETSVRDASGGEASSSASVPVQQQV